ncbi:putative MATE family efflux protein [Clostridium punense]|uniref:Multidrug export protein MepA n=1 Tax=Clostridium punense TaxID=1054297 RepID=A0ABS4K4U2_9CLOT|nr:putative MATE family efflux protein [Clostridium punense]
MDDRIFSEGKISKILLRFAIPAIISLLVAELYNMVDTIYVGRYIGPNAIAALTISFPIQRFLIALGFLVAVGTSTYVSRNLGEKNFLEIEKTIINAFVTILILMVVIPLLIFLFKESILYKLGASSITYPLTNEYVSIILIGAIFQCLGLVACYIMTALGNTKITLYANSIGAILNVILDYILVAHYGIGIQGAAIATVFSQVVSFFFIVYKFKDVVKSFKIKVSIKAIFSSLNLDIIMGIIAIGFSTFVIEISDAVVSVILNNLLYSKGGDTAIIIIGVITKISMFMFIAIIGISSAMQPIVAYNFGAEKYNRMKETVRASIKTVTFVSIIFAGILGLLSNEIIGFFLMDKEILPSAVKAFRICISLLPFTGIYYIAIYYYQAIGEAKKSFLLSVFRQLVIFIPLAFIFVQILGTLGAWIAYPVSDLISALVSSFLLNKASKQDMFSEKLPCKKIALN